MRVERIVVHHSASHPGSTTAELIRAWHKDRGWSDIGYHFVIEVDGVVKLGRPISQIGAHVANHNTGSVGICVTGDNTVEGREWSSVQRARLIEVVRALHVLYGRIPVLRHSDLADTLCPGLSQQAWEHLEGAWT